MRIEVKEREIEEGNRMMRKNEERKEKVKKSRGKKE